MSSPSSPSSPSTPSASLTHAFTVDASPAAAFAAIEDVRGWWSGNVEGVTAGLGSEFTYEVPGVHFTRFRITESDEPTRIAWHVLEAEITFTADREEWTGTTVTFDVEPDGDRTHVRFTHVGLDRSHECYDVCERAWGEYVLGSLRERIERGAGRPNSFEGEDALRAVR